MGLPHELVDVDLLKGTHKTPEFLRLNPFGQVPVLDDGGTVVFDSTRSSSTSQRATTPTAAGCRVSPAARRPCRPDCRWPPARSPSARPPNDKPIAVSERLMHWPLGRRPDEHPGLSELGL